MTFGEWVCYNTPYIPYLEEFIIQISIALNVSYLTAVVCMAGLFCMILLILVNRLHCAKETQLLNELRAYTRQKD